jgi:hypothetical protein
MVFHALGRHLLISLDDRDSGYMQRVLDEGWGGDITRRRRDGRSLRGADIMALHAQHRHATRSETVETIQISARHTQP